MKKYVTIPEELYINTEKFGTIRLEKKRRLSCGRNDLRDIKWYVYEIDQCGKKRLEYDCIVLSFSRITKKILEEAQKTIVTKGVSTAIRPNIDGNTGNIHANKTIQSEQNKIKQLVLCSGSGPLTSNFVETDEYYCYKSTHKACYYPLISDETMLHEDFRYEILKKVWETLGEEIVKWTN